MGSGDVNPTLYFAVLFLGIVLCVLLEIGLVLSIANLIETIQLKQRESLLPPPPTNKGII